MEAADQGIRRAAVYSFFPSLFLRHQVEEAFITSVAAAPLLRSKTEKEAVLDDGVGGGGGQWNNQRSPHPGFPGTGARSSSA